MPTPSTRRAPGAGFDLGRAMSTDYGEKERAFVAELADDTGRDLEGWMRAIADSKLSTRNEIIDWLRPQGFAFSRASWLERIHHNGGQLIYGEDLSAGRVVAGDDAAASALSPANAAPDGLKTFSPSAQVTSDAPELNDGGVVKLLLAAKGLRPLAEFVLREVARTLPNAAFGARDPLVILLGPKPFAALLPSPKVLRLYANFGAATDAQIRTADSVLKSPPPFPTMISINDARRVDRAFLELVATAHTAAHA